MVLDVARGVAQTIEFRQAVRGVPATLDEAEPVLPSARWSCGSANAAFTFALNRGERIAFIGNYGPEFPLTRE